MARRVVIEKECPIHGEYGPHWSSGQQNSNGPYRTCRMSQRRVLDPGSYVLIERQTDWSYDDVNRLAWIIQTALEDKLNRKVRWGDAMVILNRLAEGPDTEHPHLPPAWMGDALAGGEQP